MKLNLGCGNKKKDGFIGVDKFPCDAVDVISDLSERLPFESNSVEEIYMDNVIEHILDIPSLLSEISRVCCKGAKVTIYTPHFASHASWRDPTHVHHLSYFSMDHLEKESVSHYMAGGFRVIERRLSFGGIMGNIGKLFFRISPRSYESNWCFIFRPSTLRFVLQKT
jgi:ubiquinone/menaquinone biosynthesis C-methylase UbiE